MSPLGPSMQLFRQVNGQHSDLSLVMCLERDELYATRLKVPKSMILATKSLPIIIFSLDLN